ncbi:hypothetical protein [Bacillus salipaludis]|uniref:hypothetical protein n=1 Tax=Bacillus salipaludis TaxID=2547811 RepID=UPI002E21EC3C|nr:hypothetical protein [Bacillus salipaludis]
MEETLLLNALSRQTNPYFKECLDKVLQLMGARAKDLAVNMAAFLVLLTGQVSVIRKRKIYILFMLL